MIFAVVLPSFLGPIAHDGLRLLRFKKQFASYLAAGLGSEDIEELYTNTYAAIREDPSFKPTEKSKDWAAESKKHKTSKLTYDQKKERVAAKIAAWKEQRAGQADEEESEEDDE